ncbi:CHASE domain-containing protein [Vibrio mimicus]|uniref:histidine kinase n=1 Tax=Vibrio mimicus TaxID=674 RepID=A0A2J9VIN5_VIBMI|nr:CHASE domain-containing protein [Vibrio mimicus]KFE31499.1 sensory box protein [Vibrio mimicus]PNM63660.1 PAS domain S-box protein [Vibrio mimicus]
MSKENLGKFDVITRWIPLLVGLLLTFSAAGVLHYQNQIEAREHIHDLANQAESLIKERFSRFEYGLRGARGAVLAAGVDKLTRKQFEDYINSRDIEREFPGALGFGFIRRVPVDKEADFIVAARRDDFPHFTIRTLTPHDGDRFIIQYIYPEKPNLQAIGLDIGSETNRRKAALASVREQQPYLTAPITLVQADSKPRRGVLILLPVYPSRMELNTPDEREKYFLGWAYAPLVVDDVLSDLSSIMAHAMIQLSNTAENEPFFRSQVSNNKYYPEESITRTISVLGQEWVFELVPNDLAFQHVRWDIRWVIVLGLGVTFLSVLALNLLRTSAEGETVAEDAMPKGLKGVSLFWNSSVRKRTWPPAIAAVLLIFLTIAWLIVERELNDVKVNLTNATESSLARLEEAAKLYSRDTVSLAKTPPLHELMKTQGNGEAAEQWKARLADVFKAYMLATPEIYQIRLLTAQSGWREQVKIQQSEKLFETFKDDALQNKSGELYIRETLKMGADKVYMSDISLHREFGVIVHPERPIWRFSTPIFADDGTPFGIVIINISVKPVLSEIAENDRHDVITYVTNTEGEFIYHPDSESTFAFEHGHSFRWQDAFKEADFLSLDTAGVLSIKGWRGNFWEKQAKLLLDAGSDQRFITIHTAQLQLPVLMRIATQILIVIAIMMVFVLMSVSIQYWLWLTSMVKQREEWNLQLQNQKEKEVLRFKALLESSPEATLIVDPNGIIKMVNEEAEKVFGYGRDELEGYPMHRLFPHDLESARAKHAQWHELRPGNQRIEIAVRSDETEFPVEISSSSVQMDDGLLISVSIRNITDRLAFEQTLKQALHDAEQATQAKSVFLANTSHEIRTPLNAILGLTHLLSDESLTESQHRLVDKIGISGKSLLGIVNDVLDLSKIEANEMILEALPLDLREFLEEVASVFSTQAEAKNLDFKLEMGVDLPHWVIADSMRLRQILTNLLSNALKFTSVGHIALRAEIIDKFIWKGAEKNIVRFSITDTGIGISEEAQKRLFKPFSQADTSTSRRFGGTGLGLSIVHKLLGLMEGKIGVESREGQGSTFWTEMPLQTLSDEDIILQEQQAQTLFVLIAEDNPEEAKHLQSVAHSLGWRSEIVHDGAALVDAVKVRKTQKLRLPDVLIVDSQMPAMDGLTAVHHLAEIFGAKRPPVVLINSDGSLEQHKIEEDELGINSLLDKPINASAVFNAVNSAVSQHSGNANRVLQSTRTEAIKAKWLLGFRVLVVDDSATNLEVADYVLTQAGATTNVVASGEEAINKLKQQNEYDAVLMDVQMPGMDGLETTRYIRNTLKLHSLPIIALTAGALVEERKRAFASGMNDFLTKPISPSRLISVLRTQVAKYRGEDYLSENISSQPLSVNDWPQIEGLNHEQAQEFFMGNQQLFFTALSHLIEDNTNLSEGEQDFDGLDAKPLRLATAEQVHKLRSTSGMIGAEKMQQMASEAEVILRQQGVPANAIMAELSSELLTLIQVSKEAIAAWKKASQLELSPAERDVTETIAPETLKLLLQLLADQDLEVLDLVEQHRAALHSAMGGEAFQQLSDSLERLNFKQAKSLLESLTQHMGVSA